MFVKDLTDFWVASGQIVENEYNESGCRTQVKIKLSEPVRYFLDDSLANHHVLLIGDHVEMIREFFSIKFNEL
jgi:L-fucose isomerase-like protein